MMLMPLVAAIAQQAMMMPPPGENVVSVISYTASQDTIGTGTAAISADIPSVQDGDLIAVALMSRADVTPPAGFTLQADVSTTWSSVTQHTSVYTKTAAAADSGQTITFTQSLSYGMSIQVVVLRGSVSTPIIYAYDQLYESDTESYTSTIPMPYGAIDPDDSLIIGISSWVYVAESAAGSSADSVSVIGPVGWTQISESYEDTTSYALRLGVAHVAADSYPGQGIWQLEAGNSSRDVYASLLLHMR